MFHDLRQDDIGANPKKTPSISKEEENLLWETGALGCNTPKSLQRSVFFCVGKNFCLRRGEEQHQLKPSQFIRKKDPDHFVYVEAGSKNWSGGLREINTDNKVVPCNASPSAGERCLVYLLDMYLKNCLRLVLNEIFSIGSLNKVFQTVL